MKYTWKLALSRFYLGWKKGAPKLSSFTFLLNNIHFSSESWNTKYLSWKKYLLLFILCGDVVIFFPYIITYFHLLGQVFKEWALHKTQLHLSETVIWKTNRNSYDFKFIIQPITFSFNILACFMGYMECEIKIVCQMLLQLPKIW